MCVKRWSNQVKIKSSKITREYKENEILFGEKWKEEVKRMFFFLPLNTKLWNLPLAIMLWSLSFTSEHWILHLVTKIWNLLLVTKLGYFFIFSIDLQAWFLPCLLKKFETFTKVITWWQQTIQPSQICYKWKGYN